MEINKSMEKETADQNKTPKSSQFILNSFL